MAIENAGDIGSVTSDIGNALSSNISQLFSGKLAELWAVVQNVLKIALVLAAIFILYKIIAGIIRAILKAREKRIMRNLLTDISENVKQINEKMDVLISRLGGRPAQPAEKEKQEKQAVKSEAKKEKIKKKK